MGYTTDISMFVFAVMCNLLMFAGMITIYKEIMGL